MLFPVIFALTFICGLMLPWWFCAIVAFAAAFFLKTPRAFLSGFAGVGLAWLAFSLLKSIPNHNILAGRVAQLFHLPNWLLLLAVTVLIGALVGGFAAMSGSLMRKALLPERIAN